MTLEQYLREVAANSSTGHPALRAYVSEVSGNEVVIYLYPDNVSNTTPKPFKTSGTTIDEKIYTK